MKKIVVILLSSILLVPGLWANQGLEGNKIKIGSFLPLSGFVGFIGKGFQEGISAYVKYFNTELTKNYGGKQLDPIFIDDAFVAEKSVQAVKDLVENRKVFALVGSVGTPGIMANIDYIVKKGIPFIYQGSGATPLYLPPKRNVFPVQPSFIFEGRVMIKFIADVLKKKRIVIVYTNEEYGEGALAGIDEILPSYKRKGIVLLDRIPIARTEMSLSPIINRIKPLNPEVVINYCYGGQAIGLINAARDAGIDTKKVIFITTYVNSDTAFFLKVGDKWNDVIVGAWARPTSGDYYRNFIRAWKQYSGLKTDPTPYNIAGWIAGETFAEGLKRTMKKYGQLTWDNFIKAMETFGEKGGWSDGQAYKLSYKPFNVRDKTCRFPQQYLYFMIGKNRQYEFIKPWKNLEELYIPAY